MSKYGYKIRNIKASTLYGYNQGTRDRYDYTDAMLNHSLFSNYMVKHGLNIYKGESTRDIVCMEFDFGTRSYEDEILHIENMDIEEVGQKCRKAIETKIENEKDKKIIDELKNKLKKSNEELGQLRIKEMKEFAKNHKNKFCEMSKEELRKKFYTEGVDITYITRRKGKEDKIETIHYKMLYRSSAKAKLGQVMFINDKLYDIAYNWLTMGLGNKMPNKKAKIVEMSAYAPLTTSTVVGYMTIPVENILILKDQESIFTTMAKIVQSTSHIKEYKILDEEKTEINRQRALALDDNDKNKYNKKRQLKYKKEYIVKNVDKRKCEVIDKETDVVNTIWDGMGLIDISAIPESINEYEDTVNGMVLLRNHFFKMCGFKSNIQLFFKDWCEKNNFNYETYEVKDMFGNSHRLKDIKVITTDNAIKWKKFSDLMGNNLAEAYQYWCEKVQDDNSVFGVVKTDHASKLGDVQQMSYQMINTLPCQKSDIKELSSTSVKYVELLKNDNDEFEKFLRKYATAVNHYEMLADLYAHNHEFANSKWFRTEKRKVINEYVNKLRKGKIFINADNLTVCGNPYALLLYAVGDNWEKDPTLNVEDGVIQCYTPRFEDGELLCAIRNPHNSPNNICYFKNKYSEEIQKYFHFSNNIIAVNCIHTDVQSRANGMDFDSDFMFVTNNKVMVNAAKECYEKYPTIVNALSESGISYDNTLEEYAAMDNKLANSKMGIGESSNLAMLALTYYWTFKNDRTLMDKYFHNNDRTNLSEEQKDNIIKELYDNFVILSVLAQVIIDGCKREYDVSGTDEIKRLRELSSMKYILTKEIEDDNGDIIEKKYRCDFPKFMKYTREIKVTNNGKPRQHEEIIADKEKLEQRINTDFICPMNWMEECLDAIQGASVKNATPTEEFFIKINGQTNKRQISKIRKLVDDYDKYVKYNQPKDTNDDEDMLIYYNNLELRFTQLIDNCQKIKIGNIVTINRLIETALGIDKGNNQYQKKGKNSSMCRKMLNTLYKMNTEKFLINFQQNCTALK
jgi:hypothetical protein